MAAVVYPTPGYLVLDPTKVKGSRTGTTNGTVIEGVQDNDIFLALDADLRRRRSGIGTSAGPRIRVGRVQGAVLLIRLRNQSTTGLKIHFSHLTTDGSTMRPTGGTAAAPFAKMPTFSIIVRPTSTSEKYIYSPNWSLDLGTQWLAAHSELREQLDGSLLALMATRPTNATGPAYEWASSATIASAYSLTEGP